jgi:signal transduction histidine kinase
MEVEKHVGSGQEQKMVGNIPYTPRVKKVLALASKEARALNHSYVGTEHILLGLLREGEGVAAHVLKSLEIDIERTRNEILRELDPQFSGSGAGETGAPGEEAAAGSPQRAAGASDDKKEVKTPALKAFGRDLTELARKGEMDPVVGRRNEIRRVVQILCRRTKNNPVLIGEAGVGKTAIAEGLAQGDFTPRAEIAGRDELGMLTQSFNRMTRQLDDARASVRQREAQLESAKGYLESILANLTAGVLVFDPEMRLATANQGAEAILEIDAAQAQWKPLSELPGLADFAARVVDAFRQQGDRVWQQQIELTRAGKREGDERSLTLLVRGSRLEVAGGNGYIVVCDDISELVSAQRSAAWGEVAQRLAHEIKNPLTPIQLSAERLQMKLADKLAGTDAEILARGTGMIVSQVTAMKNMVDDFREYARTPPAALASLDLNALVREVLGLYETAATPVVLHLDPALPSIQGDSAQLRQVIHNLLQNAQDAVAGGERTDIELETARAPGGARLTVADSGPGFSQKIIARAFEPYVTTKARGTGLGLAIVKRIVDDHHGTIEIGNREGGGARVSILLRAAA